MSWQYRTTHAHYILQENKKREWLKLINELFSGCHSEEQWLSTECGKCSGWPTTSRNDELEAQVYDLMQNDRWLAIHEMAEQV